VATPPGARGERLLLYARTLRHLRWQQWVYRPLRRLQPSLPPRRSPTCEGDAAAAENLREVVLRIVSAGGAEGERLRRADEVRAGTFTFLNRSVRLRPVVWNPVGEERLWRYNLHYFDFAPDLALAYAATADRAYLDCLGALIDGWVAAPDAATREGWEPYPTSLRIVNWILALVIAGDALPSTVRDAARASLARQLAFLDRRLELHILGNHLQKNLHALVVGSLVFRGPEASRWRSRRRLVWSELEEQVLPDGGHFERSPMYHAIALGDHLELFALLRAHGEGVPPSAVDRVSLMARAYGRLSRPDGRLHLFNDAADGIAPSRSRLAELAAWQVDTRFDFPPGSWALPLTGYFGYADPGAGERLIIDCGEPGPSYQPGHAHCDLLSFELDLGGAPLVVDSGVSGYEGDPLRAYMRSTRAHNTVSIDGMEQSEVWGTFRLARRAVPGTATVESRDGDFLFRGRYRPYHDPGVEHERSVVRSAGRVRVEDRVSGGEGRTVTSWLHFHPGCTVTAVSSGLVAITPTGVRAAVRPFGVDRWTLHAAGDAGHGWYAPAFNRATASPVLEMHADPARAQPFGFELSWKPGGDREPSDGAPVR
jgi:uncharacterized heparinase superfamily protein